VRKWGDHQQERESAQKDTKITKGRDGIQVWRDGDGERRVTPPATPFEPRTPNPIPCIFVLFAVFCVKMSFFIV
jgi:hypothetical protein